MIDYIKKNHLGLLIIAFLIASSFFTAKPAVKELGAINRDTTTVSNPFRFQQGIINDTTLTQTGAITVGSSGTAVAQLNYGSCNLLPNATTIAASSTARVTCQGGTATTGQTALTGITSTSKIVGTLSTTTAAAGIAIGANAFGGLELLGATASTTSGFIETLIINNTGATYTWPTSGTASGTMQYIGIK